ncbi:putative exonuclease v protein [Zymoseptoria brevis]|uniref:Putative exonuclease v protein n=1 Tax=Zymoseptoria brevis TaxID=1047168 RepID=A0A0F4G4W5_9PEZI|nr:putative exonuclease v protein [Zymoseptoria brevis]
MAFKRVRRGSVQTMNHDDSDYGTELDLNESDYGSDLDAATWDALLTESESQQQFHSFKVEEFPSFNGEDIPEPVVQDEPEAQTHSLRLARVRDSLARAISGLTETCEQLDGLEVELKQELPQLPLPQKRERTVEVEYSEINRLAFITATETPVESPGKVDTRSPIEQFRRSSYKKKMTVTDIVSPAWCEIQYWYNLKKHGRIPRTVNMVKGSRIHKVKEMEVHTEVPVKISSKEDKLGLRLWNVIQGLRTLRATGLTRELEVFGVVEGEVFIGIIDEISRTCPDEEKEENMLKSGDISTSPSTKAKTNAIPADQRTMKDFLTSSQASGVSGSDGAWLRPLQERPRTIYLGDIKTRSSSKLPRPGSETKPAEIQLMMYRRLLLDLAANKVDAEPIFACYTVEPHKPFSDTFIASLGNIDFDFSSQMTNVSIEADDANDEFAAPESDPLAEILAHNTLSSLWSHMIAEFTKTISVNASSSSVSRLLSAEYRQADRGDVIGRHSFVYSSDILEPYLQDVMKWWKGQREPRGVDIEDAYLKCRPCAFKEICTWRAEKIEEVANKAKLRSAARAKSQV